MKREARRLAKRCLGSGLSETADSAAALAWPAGCCSNSAGTTSTASKETRKSLIVLIFMSAMTGSSGGSLRRAQRRRLARHCMVTHQFAKRRCQPSSQIIPIGPRGMVADLGHGQPAETAGVDQGKRRQIHVDIERQPVISAAPADLEPDRGDLGRADVHAGLAVLTSAVDIELGQHIDYRLFEPIDQD